MDKIQKFHNNYITLNIGQMIINQTAELLGAAEHVEENAVGS